MFIHMVGGLVGMLIGTLLSSITKRKSRRRIHGQAALTSLLLWSSPATATPVGDTLNPAMATKHCSSFLDALHLELNKQLAVSRFLSPLIFSSPLTTLTQLFTTPQPPFPRTFSPSTLLLTTFLTTTTTVLLFSLLYSISKPRTKLSLVSGFLLSSLAGGAFATDIPDLVFRYLFFGINAALICGALVASVLGTSTVVERRVVGDVEGGGQEKCGRRG
ncbi:hypothetical protein L207DRAFT_508503 [Hyaloscypha variabilis F]|uniref:Uncharacterized protein n=1 Tax=Hyaloscypha variabilis (strain UAMH 11265 / GT02V1 / F) TaxID=1149755 RepID=A0A2J6S4L0_HYAVF|nr:hypothetical protein L207DRAFT_508503 [Hyaloscypha variabilis F]